MLREGSRVVGAWAVESWWSWHICREGLEVVWRLCPKHWRPSGAGRAAGVAGAGLALGRERMIAWFFCSLAWESQDHRGQQNGRMQGGMLGHRMARPLMALCPLWDAEPRSHRGPRSLPAPLPGGDPPAGYPGLSQSWAMKSGRLSSSPWFWSSLSAMAGGDLSAELLSWLWTLVSVGWGVCWQGGGDGEDREGGATLGLLSRHGGQSCLHQLLAATSPLPRLQRSRWRGVLAGFLLLHTGEPQLWHSSLQSSPSSLRVPPRPSRASQANRLMTGPAFLNAYKCQKDVLLLGVPAFSPPTPPAHGPPGLCQAGRWQGRRQHARALGSPSSFKRSSSVEGLGLCFLQTGFLHPFPVLPWSRAGAAGRGGFSCGLLAAVLG